MSSTIHTLSSSSRSPQIAPPQVSSPQGPRFMTFQDLPRQRSRDEILAEKIEALSAQVQKMSESSDRTLQTLEWIKEIDEHSRKTINDALSGKVNPNLNLTPEMEEQLRKDRAKAEEIRSRIREQSSAIDNTVAARVSAFLDKFIVAIDRILRVGTRRVRNHQWTTTQKAAVTALIILGAGFAAYRFGPSAISRFR